MLDHSVFGFRMDNPSVMCLYCIVTVFIKGPIPAPRIIRFVLTVCSDVLLDPEYGRFAMGAESPILIPGTCIYMYGLQFREDLVEEDNDSKQIKTCALSF